MLVHGLLGGAVFDDIFFFTEMETHGSNSGHVALHNTAVKVGHVWNREMIEIWIQKT